MPHELTILKNEWDSCTKCDISVNKKIWGEGSGTPTYLILSGFTITNTLMSQWELTGLYNILEETNIKATECYLMNTVLCQCDNVDEFEKYQDACKERALRTIHVLGPQIIIALGNSAIRFLNYCCRDEYGVQDIKCLNTYAIRSAEITPKCLEGILDTFLLAKKHVDSL